MRKLIVSIPVLCLFSLLVSYTKASTVPAFSPGTEYASKFSNKRLSPGMNLPELGVNDKAYQCAVVMHGEDYGSLKNDSRLFIYHTAKTYLLTSKILNG